MMRIERPTLKALVVKVARETFGKNVFNRRPLMDAVEARVKNLGYWEASDDVMSASADPKSKGLANIDWAITQLGDERGLLHVGHDKWQVPNA